MRTTDFLAGRSPGTLVDIPKGAKAFVPAALPRNFVPTSANVRLIGATRAALGELIAGVGHVASADLLIRPFQINEAVLSSRIEGTKTTLVQAIATAKTGIAPDSDRKAVSRYGDALTLGLRSLDGGSGMSQHLIRSLHAVLMRDDPDGGAAAGQIREGQVCIGPDECREDPKLAKFIPPPPEHVQPCLDELTNYIANPETDEPLVRVAFTHYQFETIHPFQDGNGRVGRILLPLHLVHEGVVAKPWVYPSQHIEANKPEYVSRLYRVSTEGDFNGWLEFFLHAILASARTTLAKLHALQSLQSEYEERLREYHGQIPVRALPVLFELGAVVVNDIQTRLPCSKAAAANAMSEWERHGIVFKYHETLKYPGQTGRPPNLYMSADLIRVMRIAQA